MKRLLPLLIVLTLLCGCAKKEPEAPEMPPAPPAASSAPAAAVVDTGPLLSAYEAILASPGRTVSVEEPGVGDVTLPLSLGIEKSFLDRDWTAAEKKEWEDLLSSPDRGLLIALSSADGLAALRCCGELVMAEAAGKTAWFRAGEEGVYESFLTMAEASVDHSIWSVTAEGSLSPWEAAQVMVEQIAENYRNVPGWVEWKPVDVQAGDTQVFDAYLAQPQQFCANFRLRVKVEDVTDPRYGHWQAGAGLGEADSEGYCGYGTQGLAAKNEEGDWVFCERGTGGYRVILPRKEGEDNLELLVGDYFLTWGESHDWHIPYAILERSDLSQLPAILGNRSPQEARALCRTLGECLRAYDDYWSWTVESLKEVLGSYGAYLNA